MVHKNGRTLIRAEQNEVSLGLAHLLASKQRKRKKLNALFEVKIAINKNCEKAPEFKRKYTVKV